VLAKLADPRLTRMSTAQLAQLAAALAPAQAAWARQRYSGQRGGRARRARGNPRARPLSHDAARLLLTLLDQPQACSMNVLAPAGGHRTCIGGLVQQRREIPEDHGHDPAVAPVRFTTADALLSFPDSDLRPARTAIIERLSHPALTGLTRHQLHELTSRLAMRQSAQAGRLSYQRRGGPRQPGTRRPRSFRSDRKSCQAAADSPAPGARPMKAGLPPMLMPQAARTGSAGEPGCTRNKPASRNR
jgi:hypothetical protein